jgi:hypothetical protein
MNDKLIILHGVYLNAYDGTLNGFYPGGFKWTKKNRWGGEVFNFKPIFGRCYGYVEVDRSRSIHIEKLGASPKSTSVEGVIVVWTAPDPSPRRGRLVVGWYRNAVVYRDRQQPSANLKRARTFRAPAAPTSEVVGYHVEAAQEDCTLLAPEERVLWIPPRKKGTKGIPGQSPVYFPDLQTTVGPEIARRIRHFIETGEALPLAEVVAPDTKHSRGKYQPDPERRKEIEDAAMKLVEDHFVALDYNVKTVAKENRGYDLIAKKGDATLCIEVKGRSGDEIIADFTFNEFEKIRLEEQARFEDGSYRICIVTDALSERTGATVHHFWCMRQSSPGKARGMRPAWRKIDGDQILELAPREAAQGRVL